MESLLHEIPRTIVYLDDILVNGTPEGDHLKNLQNVLQKLEYSGLKLKKYKCKFMISSISCLGFKIDAQGLHLLPDKVEAILNAPAPTSVTELKSFLRLLSYYGKLIPSLSTVLYRFIKSTRWKWDNTREQANKQQICII